MLSLEVTATRGHKFGHIKEENSVPSSVEKPMNKYEILSDQEEPATLSSLQSLKSNPREPELYHPPPDGPESLAKDDVSLPDEEGEWFEELIC